MFVTLTQRTSVLSHFNLVKMLSVSCVYFLCIAAYCCMGSSAPNQTPLLSPEERYQDLFPLTDDNFTQSVLRNKDPWIVIFHDGSIAREWKTMATHLRGLCWCGLVDTTTDKHLLDTLKYEASEGSARFYPYGDRKTKREKWRNVNNQNEARMMALQSLPDKTQRISGEGLSSFLLDAFTTSPSRFPAYIITDSDDTPFALKAIAKRFERYFLFGKVVKPSTDELNKLGLRKVYMNPPELFVMVTQGGRPESLDAIKFDKDRNGAMNYTSVLQYLFQINTNFRHGLPGDNMAGVKEVAEMSDVLKIEAKRFEIIDDKTIKERINSKETVEGTIKFQTEIGVKDEL